VSPFYCSLFASLPNPFERSPKSEAPLPMPKAEFPLFFNRTFFCHAFSPGYRVSFFLVLSRIISSLELPVHGGTSPPDFFLYQFFTDPGPPFPSFTPPELFRFPPHRVLNVRDHPGVLEGGELLSPAGVSDLLFCLRNSASLLLHITNFFR